MGTVSKGFFKQKPSPQELSELCPELDKKILKEHLAGLKERYFQSTDKERIAEHLRALAVLDESNRFQLIVNTIEKDGRSIEVTIIGIDHPGTFSILTGLLSASGMDIQSGNIYTYHEEESLQTRSGLASIRERREAKRRLSRRFYTPSESEQKLTERKKARIIDTFYGVLPEDVNIRAWEDCLRSDLDRAFSFLSSEKKEDLEAAKQFVNEKVTASLKQREISTREKLYPVNIEIDTSNPSFSRMTVVSEDTPFFLYSLSTALALHDISIINVSIRTHGQRISDSFDFVGHDGKPVHDHSLLNRIRLSVLFTKQFTYFLGEAPDPYTALRRFEHLAQDIIQLPGEEELEKALSDPNFLSELARLLGTSDFLWEDFIRVQYENLLPLISANRNTYLSTDSIEIGKKIKSLLREKTSLEEKVQVLNEFKDREIYLIDLDHILNPEADFFFLSSRLTALAEAIVNETLRLQYEEHLIRYGRPRTAAGIEAVFAVFGLGKLGGAALGYASDIELLFLYNDNGNTDGTEQISNAEFFEKLFRETVASLKTKREGIFEIDLRLRPYGKAGPVACSLETFCKYYQVDGGSHSFERLALVRMRWIGGDENFGHQIERIRDELIYSSNSIDLGELKQLRQKQLDAKARKTGQKNALNAKFSPGALVDLEYSVQILQIIYGKNETFLRTPKIHLALEGLVRAGLMAGFEAERLVLAYRFLRHLINGLRMLRGNAKDLFLPELDSMEYMHLARRMGYKGEEDLNPAEQLHIEFETRTAAVRAFVEGQLGRDAIPGPVVGNAADLVLGSMISEEVKEHVLGEIGFADSEKAFRNIRLISGEGERRELFARLAVLAWDLLKTNPDPDMALNNWERFVSKLSDSISHFNQLLHQPTRLQLLLDIFAASQFLADTLILNPGFFLWVTSPKVVNSTKTRTDLEPELSKISEASQTREEWLSELGLFRKREILRIGTRDLCLGVHIATIVEELSDLASTITAGALSYIWAELTGEDSPLSSSGFAVLAFGKLGGRELNYSSDLDLLGVFDPETGRDEALYAKCMERLRSDLSDHSFGGYVYRVDLRLRPYGRSGRIVYSMPAILQYYEKNASLWEYQALIKLRPVAGDEKLGKRIIDRLRVYLISSRPDFRVSAQIQRLRRLAIKAEAERARDNIKVGPGGIRDIEFLVQGLELINAGKAPEIIKANTVAALDSLSKAAIIDFETAETLKKEYFFLRRIEHFLQIFEDRQVHNIPRSKSAREALARRIRGRDCNVDAFIREIKNTMKRVRNKYINLIGVKEEKD